MVLLYHHTWICIRRLVYVQAAQLKTEAKNWCVQWMHQTFWNYKERIWILPVAICVLNWRMALSAKIFDLLSTHNQGFLKAMPGTSACFGTTWSCYHDQHDGRQKRFVQHLDSLFTMEVPINSFFKRRHYPRWHHRQLCAWQWTFAPCGIPVQLDRPILENTGKG